MKSILLSTLITALRMYVGSGLFDRIATEVRKLAGSRMTGQQRMQSVLEFATRELSIVSENLVRAVVEIVLLKDRA